MVDHEDEFQWSRTSQGRHAWMVRCDENGVYHGHSTGVTAYCADGGRELWAARTNGSVLFGWQEHDSVYAGTAHRVVQRISKANGRLLATYACDQAVYSCATAPQGQYVFAGDCGSSVYCFAEDGTRLWKLRTGLGSALSMQYFDGRLYIVTTDGSIACIDASPEAIAAAQSGTMPATVDVKSAVTLPTFAPAPAAAMPTTTAVGSGVVVECFDDRGQLRVRVSSPGYHPDWYVQFPRHIRTAGARYVVDAVHPSDRGFYRVRGDIRQLL